MCCLSTTHPVVLSYLNAYPLISWEKKRKKEEVKTDGDDYKFMRMKRFT